MYNTGGIQGVAHWCQNFRGCEKFVVQ